MTLEGVVYNPQLSVFGLVQLRWVWRRTGLIDWSVLATAIPAMLYQVRGAPETRRRRPAALRGIHACGAVQQAFARCTWPLSLGLGGFRRRRRVAKRARGAVCDVAALRSQGHITLANWQQFVPTLLLALTTVVYMALTLADTYFQLKAKNDARRLMQLDDDAEAAAAVRAAGKGSWQQGGWAAGDAGGDDRSSVQSDRSSSWAAFRPAAAAPSFRVSRGGGAAGGRAAQAEWGGGGEEEAERAAREAATVQRLLGAGRRAKTLFWLAYEALHCVLMLAALVLLFVYVFRLTSTARLEDRCAAQPPPVGPPLRHSCISSEEDHRPRAAQHLTQASRGRRKSVCIALPCAVRRFDVYDADAYAPARYLLPAREDAGLFSVSGDGGQAPLVGLNATEGGGEVPGPAAPGRWRLPARPSALPAVAAMMRDVSTMWDIFVSAWRFAGRAGGPPAMRVAFGGSFCHAGLGGPRHLIAMPT